MAGPSSDVAELSLMGITEDITSMQIRDPGQEANEDGKFQQVSGVLIELLKVPLGQTEPFIPDSCSGDGVESFRKPPKCWKCSRLVASLSKKLAECDMDFIIGSSVSNCDLNHELLIAIRSFLTENTIRPDKITLESASSGPLRLRLATKRQHAEETMTTHPGQSGLQTSDITTWKTESDNDSQVVYMVQSYDVYQEFQAAESVIPEIWIPKASRISKHGEQCFTLSKAWLDDCLENHPKCSNHSMSELPRRVIDVTPGRLRLVVPRVGKRAHWVALSHCWGQSSTFKTTSNTLESHKRRLDWEELPKTFRDAICVTRALGVRYLWIDSLCIIQDDGGVDFHAEAAKMLNIYRDSIVTIAASCSASDYNGFLQERMIDDPVKLAKPQKMESIRFRQAIDHSRMLRDDPIHSRAWTFQETILPRRLLSFGSCEATWECETLRKCECHQIEYEQEASSISNELCRATYREVTRAVMERRFYVGKENGLPGCGPGHRHAHSSLFTASIKERFAAELLAERPSAEDQETHQNYLSYVTSKLAGSQEAQPHDVQLRPRSLKSLARTYINTMAVSKFHRYWRRVLVPEYTCRALSKDNDRLIALQAIASDIWPRIVDDYLAGMWEGDLVNQLCWKSADGPGLPADNQSPSWSWSSIRGPIVPFLAEEFEHTRFDLPEFTVLSAKCELASESPCGRILSGSVTFKATAMEVRYIKNKDTGLFGFHPHTSRTEHPEHTEPVPLKLDFSPDTPLGCQADGSLTRSAERDCLNTKSSDHVLKAILFFPKFTDNRGIKNWCVLVCSRVSAESNTCRRLGIGTINLWDNKVFLPTSQFLFTGEFVLV